MTQRRPQPRRYGRAFSGSLRTLLAALLLLASADLSLAATPVTIYLAGDSTMAEKVAERRPETGWGEKLLKFFDERSVRVENHAQDGRSTRTFIESGRWATLIDKVHAGDYVFIQFGHNDAAEGQERYTSPEDYRRNLARFIADVRARRATPVLLTPAMRRRFNGRGELLDTHGVYPEVVRKLAAAENVPLIDMHRDSARVLREYGKQESKKLFLILGPGLNPNYPLGMDDNTHFSPLGAEEMAALTVDAIRALIPGLARCLKDKPAVTSQLHGRSGRSVFTYKG